MSEYREEEDVDEKVFDPVAYVNEVTKPKAKHIVAEREHEIACGHRVVGHEGKCKHLHGHNYLIRFVCELQRDRDTNQTDSVGRVIDFSVIKEKLCEWLEDNWDHKTLLWEKDQLLKMRWRIQPEDMHDVIDQSFVPVPFNPTAENIAKHLLEVIGPQQLKGTGVTLIKVVVGETRKCQAAAVL